MNFQQAQILLEKINAMWRSMNAAPGAVSAIERDLMLSYLRQLYGNLLELQPAQPSAAATPQPQPKPAPPRPEPPKPEAPKPEPAVVVPPPKPAQTPPPVAPPPQPKPQPQAVKAPVSARPASAYESLFNFKKIAELSDKLGLQPIPDLTKAFSINDRLLYINDLFGKDQNAFVESVRLLDRFDELGEAKGLLLNLAEQYDWLQEERTETAQSFVQLVQRRYLKH